MDEFALIRQNFIEIAPDPSGKNGKPGPNPEVQCVNCDHTFKGGVSRQRAHLLGQALGVSKCEKVHADTVTALQKFVKDRNADKQQKQKLRQLDELTRTASGSDLTAGSKRKQQKLDAAFDRSSKAEADAATARFFYAEGVAMQKASCSNMA